jgi:serine/threonine-protein kinase
LAKALEGETPPDSSLSQSPTLTAAATQAGVILGTAGYMSPEQARGEATDRKADVWAFGCVLFEMLTRQATFDGKTVSDVLAGVLRTDPEWKSLPPNLHPQIRLLLERSLEKESKDRYHDIADARLDIQKALADPNGVLVQPTGDVGQAQPRPILPWVLAALFLGAVTAGVAVWSVMGPAAQSRLARFAVSEQPGVLVLTGESTPSVTISPDGTRIVYVGPQRQLYVRAVDQLDAVALRGGVGINPFVSPDGNWVGFRGSRADDTLKKVSIHGGPPVVLSESIGGIAGASWGADDSIIFGTVAPNGLFRVSAAGGEEREMLTNLEEGESSHRWPEILPGGRTVLFTIEKGQGDANREIAALNLETGERKLLIPGGSNPHYAATGHIVYGADGTLRAVPFDLEAVEVKGDPIPVLEGIVTQIRGDAHFSLAEDGTLVYVPGTVGGGGQQLTFVWVDREGREEPVAAEPRVYQEFSLSPDGTKIAVPVFGPENQDVWIYDLVRDTQMRLTFDLAYVEFPIWTPDGQRVAFGSSVAPLSWKAADGTGEVETLGESSSQIPMVFSPDGTTLVFNDRNSSGWDLGMLSLEGERISTLLLETEFSLGNAALSPDGRWMAYVSNESGQYEVYVRPFPDVNGGRWQVSSGGGGWPLWSPDGLELFYVGSEGMMAVPIETEPTFTQGTVDLLFDLGPYAQPLGRRSRMIAISPEGDRFLMLRGGRGSDAAAAATGIIVVLNWFEELKQRVPVP